MRSPADGVRSPAPGCCGSHIVRTGGQRAAGLALVLVLTACGVPQDDAPRALDPATAPFSDPSPSAGAAVGAARVGLWFVRDGRLVLTRRPVPQTAGVPELLDLLLAGPTESELADGTSSLIPASLTVEDVVVDGGTGVVTLGGPADQVSSAQPLAFGQIVATLTGQGGLDGVRFRLDGSDLPVPSGDGRLSAAPLDGSDYAPLGTGPGPS